MVCKRASSGKILTPVVMLLAFLLLCPMAVMAAEKKKFVVVIDAGHGGNDVGAHENGVQEKDINLAVALDLGEMIKKKLKDTQVVYTRDDDTFLSLQKRAEVANKAKADLFISIHTNSVDRSNKNRSNVVGATTYVLGHHKDADNLAVAQRENAVVELDADDSAHFSSFDPESDESHIIFEMTQKKNFQNSIRFASDVQKEMAAAGRYSRGVQQAGFWVLWSTAMPAVLVELDFICNPEQAKFLASKEGQEKLAGAIFNAVKNYESYYRRSLGLAENQPEQAPAESGTSRTTQVNQPVQNNQPVQASRPVESHRASQTGHATASTGNHRRRSAAARADEASQAGSRGEIALSEEPRTDTASAETAPEPPAPKSSKTDKKSGKKEAEPTGKPARRGKDSRGNRRALRQKVSVAYKVLLFESDQELKANDEAFKGLAPVSMFKENNIYKYTYGESADRREMELLELEIFDLFPDARVIKCYQ